MNETVLKILVYHFFKRDCLFAGTSAGGRRGMWKVLVLFIHDARRGQMLI